MVDPRGFLKTKRQTTPSRPVSERLKDYKEVTPLRTDNKSQEQASRCMDCGTPFCHWGCPVGNYIPEWNDLIVAGRWERAIELLHAGNNLPEITGRLCPAPCEYACVLGINDDPITIRENELAIVEHAFAAGLIKPQPPAVRTGKKVAVIGSGPAGLAAAAQLNKAGHTVTVFEKDQKIGGILRYGIPDFKLEKTVIDRRVDILKQEGIIFKTGTDAGVDISVDKLQKDFDAICLTGGSRVPRDLPIPGRDLAGVYFAMEYLMQSNRRVSGEPIAGHLIDAKGKSVVVIGGGDTGSDCVGTAHRQGAAHVEQIELMPRPLDCRTDTCPWPKYPPLFKTTSSHEEGGQRQWSILTKKFTGENGVVKKLSCVRAVFEKDATGKMVVKEQPGSEFEISADLVVLAMGFVFPEKKGLIASLGVEIDDRGNVKADANFMTSVKNVFAAGDIRRGQSLIVWAISEARRAAYAIDKHLMGSSSLPNS
ncbi:MAG: glutamate synthase subunit beta [Endomicrobiales bacterium]